MDKPFMLGEIGENPILYIPQPDGTWLNSYTEEIYDADFMAFFFADYIGCACVLPEQECVGCEARRKAASYLRLNELEVENE